MRLLDDHARFSSFQARTGMREDTTRSATSTYIMEKTLIQNLKNHAVENTDYLIGIFKGEESRLVIFANNKAYCFEEVRSIIMKMKKGRLINTFEAYKNEGLGMLKSFKQINSARTYNRNFKH